MRHWIGARRGLLISVLEKLNLFGLTSLITLVLLMWKRMGLLLRKNHMLGLSFCSKLDCGSYIISITKTASKKFGALIQSMKFLSPEVVLYLNKFTIWPCLEYCCHVWASASYLLLGNADTSYNLQILRIRNPWRRNIGRYSQLLHIHRKDEDLKYITEELKGQTHI